MPVSIEDALKGSDSQQTQQQPQKTGAKPPAAPSQGQGLPIASLFQNKAAQKNSPGLISRAASDASTASNTVLRPYLDDAVQWAKEYGKALDEDVHAYPQGTGNQVLQSLKTANDALGYALGPVLSPINTGLVKPVRAAIAKLGSLVEAHAADDIYNAQAKREGNTGQQYPKGLDLKVHKADVRRTTELLQDASEALINAGVAVISPEKLGMKPVSAEKPIAAARAALQDTEKALKPTVPELKPVALSLDKTVGFGKIAANAGLEKIPVGANRSLVSVLDDMTPHAEGYAKTLLEKLSAAIPKDTQIQFRKVAGFEESNHGVFMPELNVIQIKAGAPDIVHTTVHEMAHAATMNALDSLVEGDLKEAAAKAGRDLTAKEKLAVVSYPKSPLLKDLDVAIKEARTRASKAGLKFYGLQSERLSSVGGDIKHLAFSRMNPRYEFIAEVFSNPKLQEFLANSEKYASAGYKFKNILSQLADMIGKHLGIKNPEEMKLFHQSMDVGTRLLRMQTNDILPTKRSMYQIVAHLPNGGTITRGDVKLATTAIRAPQVVTKAKNALSISVEGVLRSVNPEGLGEKAKLAAAVIAGRITEQMQKTSAWQHGSRTSWKFWQARPDLSREFVNAYERGKGFSDPAMEDMARRYREWNADILSQDSRISGLDYEPRDNYLYHVFEDSEGVSNYFQKKYGSKWGDPKFIKDRVFDLYAEAIEAGFTPKFSNPEDIMLARQHASDVAAMHTKILEDLERYGLATKKVKGGTRLETVIDAEGKAQKVLIEKKGTVQPEGTQRWRAPNGQVYWVHNQADAVMQNAFKSKSLWEDKSMVGLGFRGAMALKNALVPIRLAISLFHPLHVTGIDIAAGWTRTTAGLLSGTTSPARALGEYLRSGFGPLWDNPKSGWRVLRAWRGQVAAGELTEADATSLRYMVEGGMIPEMSSQYRVNARENFGKALRSTLGEFRGGRAMKGGLEAAKATWHLPWATLSAISAPLFEHWIPALKAASYLKDVKSILERNPELVENDAARQLTFRRIAKSIDNRYGEMAYNTLFWKRWIKDIAVLDTLSLGWQLGFLREYGGGLMDVGQFAAGGNKLQRIAKGQLDRPIFVASYTVLGAATAGLMTWGMTGEYPKDLLDWVSPRTGEKNPDGTDQRVSTMFYSREFAALYKHIENQGAVSGLSQLVLNKGSGLFGMMHEWVTGLDSFGREIRDPDGDAFQKLEQTLAYTLADLEPISMKSIQEQSGEQPNKEKVLSVLGFTPAPKYLTETKTQAAIKLTYDKYVAPKQTPYEKAEFSREFTTLRKAYQTGNDNFGPMLDEMSDKYGLSSKDQRRLMKSLNSDLAPEVRMFMRLPWQEQIKVLDKATPEERDQLLIHASKEHVRGTYVPPEDR